MEPTLVASCIGLIATTQIHIAKGLQKYGIDALRPNSREIHSVRHHTRKKILYFTGIILNNLAFLWALVANMYAPTSYYTSAFGFGLVVLMIFSETVLHEKHTSMQHIGAVIIAAGTILIGFGSSSSAAPGMSRIRFDTVLFFITFFFPLLFLGIGLSLRFKLKKTMAVLFGTLTGCSAALDPIFKGIGQTAGTRISLIPHTTVGWLFFLGSFIFGSMAFLFTQVGFYRDARASTLIAFHNIVLILVPILLLKISLPGFTLTHTQSTGLLCVIAGIAFMFTESTLTLFRRRTKNQGS